MAPAEIGGDETTESGVDPKYADLKDEDYPGLVDELDDTDDEDDQDDEPLETDEAPDGAEGAAPADAAAQPQPGTADQPKVDAKGNVHDPRTGKFAGKVDGQGQPEGAQPGAEATGEPAPGDGSQPAAEALRAPETVEEFRWRTDGKPYRFPGSKVTAEGVFIPKEFANDLRTLVNEGMHHRTGFRQQLQSQVEARRGVEKENVALQAEIVKWREYGKRLYALVEQGPDAVASYLEKLEVNWPKLQADATLAEAKALADGLRERGFVEGAEADPLGNQPRADEGGYEVSDEELAPQLVDAMHDLREQSPDLRILTDDEIRDFADEWRDRYGRFFVVWDQEDDIERGFTRGQVILREGQLLDAMKRIAQRKAHWVSQSSQARAAEEANKRRLGGGEQPPPGVGSKGTGGGAPVRDGGAPNGQAQALLPPHGDKQALDAWLELPLDVRSASTNQGKRAKSRGEFEGSHPRLKELLGA